METQSPAAAESSAGVRGTRADLVRRPVNVVIVVAAVLALGLRLFQLSRPGFLFGVSEYDDGVFFGNALRLAGGAVPYRDFASVEPPGSTLLMAPVALLAKAAGTGGAMAAARLLTVAADTACVVLTGLLVRHRGVLAVVLACGIYAVFPGAVVAAHTFMLEPWLNLCCLAGAVLVFDGDRLAGSSWRLAWGGALLGVAATVKIWALVPAAVIGLLCLPRPRRAAAYAAGVIAGVLVPVLPFLILAPGALVRGVLVGELTRAGTGRGPELPRFTSMTGLDGVPGVTPATVVRGSIAIAAFVLAAYAIACLAARRPPAALDWYALLGAVTVTVMFVWPSEFYNHYAAFAGPFLALIIALPLGMLAGHEWLPPAGGRWLRGLAAATAAAAIAVMAVTQAHSEGSLSKSNPRTAADKVIPPGACVLSDFVSNTIAADRFVSDVPGCPLMVDSFGTLIALTKGKNTSAQPQVLETVRQEWRSSFTRAQYVWLQGDTSGRIPWSPALVSYFTSHFELVRGFPHDKHVNGPVRGGLYVKTSLAATQAPG